jgi:hypothetical protein
MEIKGKILDSTNEPLYLANITIITGSQTNKFGTVANENGEFNLDSDIISAESQFKISYQGFKPQFYKASELQDKKIKLEEDIIGLNEVVVFSHGKPKDIIASDQPSNIKQHFQKHKLVYAGLGGIVGLLLLLTSIKKLK